MGEMPKKVIFGWILDGFGCTNYFFFGFESYFEIMSFSELKWKLSMIPGAPDCSTWSGLLPSTQIVPTEYTFSLRVINHFRTQIRALN